MISMYLRLMVKIHATICLDPDLIEIINEFSEKRGLNDVSLGAKVRVCLRLFFESLKGDKR